MVSNCTLCLISQPARPIALFPLIQTPHLFDPRFLDITLMDFLHLSNTETFQYPNGLFLLKDYFQKKDTSIGQTLLPVLQIGINGNFNRIKKFLRILRKEIIFVLEYVSIIKVQFDKHPKFGLITEEGFPQRRPKVTFLISVIFLT